ncbi:MULTISPECIES: hypothetical protein [Anoxybacillus]|uniref:Uncharacterized protein n=1 Tax=Anoxybacillus flavithermus TaxID=33934 RepID=A0A178TEN4_9BACL|nr:MULTISPECIES: hypothetical protein [Anoxybacillus]ASA96854.1 hypothetical protein CA592_08565 [Anoxybacillus flavithermus]MBE2905369.1 hypothetical protein [Anoxybacillus flavithermus]MBE2912682.1 hypothetical protein [Anoxybacillus flavithermus]MBE2919265.1 hypothetical protein [Anoxybacillus flavithermus]MBE2921318.1 hypothetical protein [Anoxybacillus flavithermus]
MTIEQQTNKEIVQAIEQYVEQESEEWVQHVLSNAKTVGDLMTALWEHGKVKKDGTEVERMLHRLIYERGASTIKALIREMECLVSEKALSHFGDSAIR